MDIFEVITADHEKVKKILDQMQHTTPKAGKRREQLLQSLTENLQPHMYAEEQYFYQVLLDETDEKETAFEAIEEHRAAKMVLSDLHEAALDDPRWAARCKVLKELVEHHIEEEESEVFEIARKVFDGERASSAAKRFKEMKKEAPAHVG
jgi:hemerythrin-like domain-containing protein